MNETGFGDRFLSIASHLAATPPSPKQLVPLRQRLLLLFPLAVALQIAASHSVTTQATWMSPNAGAVATARGQGPHAQVSQLQPVVIASVTSAMVFMLKVYVHVEELPRIELVLTKSPKAYMYS